MSELAYEQARHEVFEFIKAHVERLEAQVAQPRRGLLGQPSTILVDYNGTLDHPQNGAAIDDFVTLCLCAGIPVKLITGRPGQEFNGEAAPLLVATGALIAKPFRISDCYPGMIIDDLELMGPFATGTYVSPASPFFSAWQKLNDDDKRRAIIPWVEFHQNLPSPDAAAQQNSQPDSGPESAP
jgi:hypothetical protein